MSTKGIMNIMLLAAGLFLIVAAFFFTDANTAWLSFFVGMFMALEAFD